MTALIRPITSEVEREEFTSAFTNENNKKLYVVDGHAILNYATCVA